MFSHTELNCNPVISLIFLLVVWYPGLYFCELVVTQKDNHCSSLTDCQSSPAIPGMDPCGDNEMRNKWKVEFDAQNNFCKFCTVIFPKVYSVALQIPKYLNYTNVLFSVHMYSHGPSLTHGSQITTWRFSPSIMRGSGVSGPQTWQQVHLPSELFCKPSWQLYRKKGV